MKKTIAFYCGMVGMGILATCNTMINLSGNGIEINTFGKILFVPILFMGSVLFSISFFYFFYIQPSETKKKLK